MGCIVDGCPPGLALTVDDIQPELDRRKPGSSRYTTQRREADQVEILSGVFENSTTGTPIGLLIRNTEQRSRDYTKIADRFRPGHADYTYLQKYGIRDYRGGGRASARETVLRVAAGAIAKKYLRQRYGIEIRGYVSQIGNLKPATHSWEAVEKNPFFWPAQDEVTRLGDYIDELRRAGDSVGAAVTVEARQVPVGWGEPVYSRLDADIAAAMMSINAVKGVEIGSGFQCVSMKGSECRDEMTSRGFASNHAGGILGGISSGQPIVATVAFKPTSSIVMPGKTVDVEGRSVNVSVTGRHDPCVGLRAPPIVEAMLALVLIDHALRHRGQNADVSPPAPIIASELGDESRIDEIDVRGGECETAGED